LEEKAVAAIAVASVPSDFAKSKSAVVVWKLRDRRIYSENMSKKE
jgi:hypothetical protein